MTSSIISLVIEAALFFMKVFGVSAQNKTKFLEFIDSASQKSTNSIEMKDSWKQILHDLKRG